MTRRYDEQVDVRRRDDEPAQFLWRGRLYVVRDVLDHWVEVGTWWSGAGARALLGTDVAGADGGTGAPPLGGLAVDDAEREVWRVEASAGRAAGSGVYDLCLDGASGSWTLARAMD
ncbi:DUF6504 family protein [Vallicoccus soli]|uniref:DUF6504 domain-containing protein n=1 Tax=Vallicoccus soli TaxID=2339232 RepID=A0A3A3Z0X3_9ACTN|nr:DUF6504 family protein [Vallicoccus soli]RJK96833.1 hypothetical protein D5H78_06105 [Vallicoccus soli]